MGRWSGESRRPQLHLVPRNIGTGLYGRATIGRTAAAISRKPDSGVFASTRATIRFRNNICGVPWRRSVPTLRAIWRSILRRSPPKAANDGDRNLAAQGKNDLLEGIPEANIVSCYACHGPNAEGVRDIPRLGGLAYFYLKGAARTVGPRISFGHSVSDADGRAAIWARTKSRRSLRTSALSSNRPRDLRNQEIC